VNGLCEVFSHADVEKLMSEYLEIYLKGKTNRKQDTVIHFYEDFLNEYDPVLRKKMGAYYTPLPVVEFMVRSVDHVLKKEFGLLHGLADTTKLPDGKHKVQILDPAVGTGTFISAVIGQIFRRFKGQGGRWPSYVLHDLLPRLHGFELMMAPYTIAHLKLGMAFKETGFKYFNDRRLGIYLTNSLEKVPEQSDLFTAFGLAESIAEESKEASLIKNNTPVMVVIGNPPYSGESSNAQYRENDAYKIEPGGGKLQERNSKWLNDDYVKFIRLAESMIEKNGEGVVAMITPHGYIDNPTFRGMRWHLMKTFDEIYVLDLHGNTNKKEKSPDGTEDKTVFDIKTGVAIFFGVKKKDGKSELAKIHSADLCGKRQSKFKYLNDNLINSVKWNSLIPSEPNYEWVMRDVKKLEEYNKGFSINELFPVSSVGVVTSRDAFVIDTNKKVLADRIQEFLRCQTPQEAKAKFNLKENQKWKIANALKHEFDEKNIVPICYRPFDTRYIYYHDDFIERSRLNVMRHMLAGNNFSLSWIRPMSLNYKFDIFISKNIIDQCYAGNKSAGAGISYAGPAYLYDNGKKKENLDDKISKKISEIVGNFTAEEIINYSYAILHSQSYKNKFIEELKVGFPRIPYPSDKTMFAELVKLGNKLRQLHLLDSPEANKYITTYPETGSDVVDELVYKDGNIIINETQYFGNVPMVAWSFWIGGYQPAQKWLKDRKGRILDNKDIEHYQKIIVALVVTDRIVKELDKV
jgi:predicted helicase